MVTPSCTSPAGIARLDTASRKKRRATDAQEVSIGSGRAKQPPLLMPASVSLSAASGANASASATGAPRKADGDTRPLPPCGAETGMLLSAPVTRRALIERALAEGAGPPTAGMPSELSPPSAGVGGRMLLRLPEFGLVEPHIMGIVRSFAMGFG